MSITVVPPLATNTIFYKYEPFAYTFTGGSNFAVSGTLATYCVVNASNVVFSTVNGFQSTGSPLGETLAVTSSLGTVPYTLFINAGRFQLSPATTSLVLYRSEPVNYTFTSSVPLTTAYSTPTLPPGLTFTSSNASVWKLSGTPTTTASSSNYLFLGSNYANGTIVSTSLPIQVVGERLVMSSGPTTATALTIGTAIAPIPFTILNYPLTAGTASFRGLNLPPGLNLTTNSSTLPGANAVISGTPTSNTISNVTSTVTATTSLLTASSTVLFTYSTVVIFTAVLSTATFYLNVPASLQVTATTLFPSNLPIGLYTADTLPSGLNMSITGLISGTPTALVTSNATVVTATTLSGLSGSNTLSLTTVSNTLSATSNVPAHTFTIGLKIPPITITFTSLASTPITITSNVPPGIVVGSNLSSTVFTLSGIPATLATNAVMSVTANTLGALPLTVNITYSTSNDTFLFSSVPSSPFTFRQNVAITPVQFSAVASNQSAPIVYFTNTNAIPNGLYVTPGGTLLGTPTGVTTTTALNGVSATNGYVTIVSPPGFSYTVLADEVLATSASVSNMLVPNTPVNIPLTVRALSGIVPTGNIVFSSYSYGITATTSAIGGTLGTCVYPDIVIPSYIALRGVISNTVPVPGLDGLPVVFGLRALNVQTITRYTLRWNGSNVSVCKDDGAFRYSTLPILSANTFTGYLTADNANTYRFLTITSGAPTIPMPIGTILSGTNVVSNTTVVSGAGTTYQVTPLQPFTGPPGAATISYYLFPGSNAPRDFQWGGSTFVIADGTSNLVTSSNSISFSRTSPDNFSRFYQCAYMSTVSRWITVSSNFFSVSSNSDPTLGWYASNTFSLPVRDDGSYLLRTFPTPSVAGSTRIAIGGRILSYADIPTSTLLADGPPGGPVFTPYTINLINILALSTTKKLVMGGSPAPTNTPTIQYSSDSNTWSNANNSFTTRTTEIVSGGPNAALGWLAIGSNGTTPGVKYSADAITWVDVGLSFPSGTVLGPIQFDGTSWCVFGGSNVYRHDGYAGNITDGATWTMTQAYFNGWDSSKDVLYTFPPPIVTGGPPTVTLYTGETPNGPTFTSPTGSTYELYQYVVIPSLVFAATSSGGDIPVYFLASTPPPGMLWNSSTATLSGRIVRLGTFSVDVYAQSKDGVSKKSITFIVSQVLISHKTPTAAAYTAYQRNKVIADAATATVDDHAVPFEVGPFLLARPPNKTTAPEICCDGNVKIE